MEQIPPEKWLLAWIIRASSTRIVVEWILVAQTADWSHLLPNDREKDPFACECNTQIASYPIHNRMTA